MVLVQKCPFLQLFFLGNIRQENVFYDILEGENAFRGYKHKKFKEPKSDIFRKGLTLCLGPKMAIFPTFLFLVIEARKMSLTILQNKKTPLQAIKTRSSKIRKIDIFSKGLTHGFRPKMAIFPIFFFLAVQARKTSFTIFQNKKKALLGYKNKRFKKSKN